MIKTSLLVQGSIEYPECKTTPNHHEFPRRGKKHSLVWSQISRKKKKEKRKKKESYHHFLQTTFPLATPQQSKPPRPLRLIPNPTRILTPHRLRPLRPQHKTRLQLHRNRAGIVVPPSANKRYIRVRGARPSLFRVRLASSSSAVAKAGKWASAIALCSHGPE